MKKKEEKRRAWEFLVRLLRKRAQIAVKEYKIAKKKAGQ